MIVPGGFFLIITASLVILRLGVPGIFLPARLIPFFWSGIPVELGLSLSRSSISWFSYFSVPMGMTRLTGWDIRFLFLIISPLFSGTVSINFPLIPDLAELNPLPISVLSAIIDSSFGGLIVEFDSKSLKLIVALLRSILRRNAYCNEFFKLLVFLNATSFFFG